MCTRNLFLNSNNDKVDKSMFGSSLQYIGVRTPGLVVHLSFRYDNKAYQIKADLVE